MPVRDDHFWLGSLSMTAALAAKDTDPRPILKSALRDFLRDRPAGDPLAAMIRAELKGKS